VALDEQLRARPLPASVRRRRALLLALGVCVLVVALLVLRSRDGGSGPRLVPSGAADDPLAWSPAREPAMEQAASQGLAHVLYSLSPGGAAATAQRVERFRPLIQHAVAGTGLDPDTVEAMVFLESAGRPNVVAGNDVHSAAGLGQILAETASNLLGMRVDVARSQQLTNAIAQASAAGDAARVARLEARRRAADARFDPASALAGTVRYLTIARDRFGRDDLAVESYHMGIGNLETALRLYAGEQQGAIGDVIRRDGLTYGRLYFDSSPTRHGQAYALLNRLGDDSRNYYWKVLAAREILRLWRADPGAVHTLDTLQREKPSAEDVLRPPSSTPSYGDAGAVSSGMSHGDLQAIPNEPRRLHLRIAPSLAAEGPAYRALRPEALATLLYLAQGVHRESGTLAPLTLLSAVRDAKLEAASATGDPTFDGRSAHTTGYAFDIARRYASGRQAEAFQYELDRLQALDLIAWVREPTWIHVVVGARASALVAHELRPATTRSN
jgi:hypothetical protein